MTWLNVACGHHYFPNWINFDLTPEHEHLDLCADLLALPFPDGVFTKVYVGHTLEHLIWEEIPPALHELQRVMTPTAELMVVGPDIERALRTKQPQWLLDAIIAYDTATGPWCHKWTATGLLTLIAVRTVFPNAVEVPIASVTSPKWANPTTAEWQCAVHVNGV